MVYSQIRLPLVCFLILVYCYWHYSRKKRLKTKASKIFTAMNLTAIFNLAATTITEYTVNNRDKVSPLFNDIWHILFLISITATCYLLLLYMLVTIERGSGKRQKTDKITLSVVCAAGAVGQILLPIEYIDTENGSYSLGMKAYALYVVVIYVLFVLLWKTAHFHDVLGKEKSKVLVTSTAIFVIAAVVQIFRPYILLTGAAITMLILGLLISTEDSYLYASYKTGLFNELACKEILRERLFRKKTFWIKVFVFNGKDPSIEKEMIAYEKKIKDLDGSLMCGTMADNVLVIIPTYSYGRGGVRPEKIPDPIICEADIRFKSELIRFDGYESLDVIESTIRDRKSRYEAEYFQIDDLTGLLRREAFVVQVNGLLERNEPFSMLMIDLDDFKLINDRFGHNIGDIVLKTAADIFRSVTRSSDVVCRMGGDEFAIVLSGTVTKDGVRIAVGRIMDKLSNVNILPDSAHKIGISVGVRMHVPQPEKVTFKDVYTQADRALYEIKRSGKSGMAFYEDL